MRRLKKCYHPVLGLASEGRELTVSFDGFIKNRQPGVFNFVAVDLLTLVVSSKFVSARSMHSMVFSSGFYIAFVAKRFFAEEVIF